LALAGSGLTRWPLAAELGIRSLVTAVAIAIQVALSPFPIESNNDFPVIMVVTFVISVVLAGA
jgi:hypothetical protein